MGYKSMSKQQKWPLL